MVITKLQVVALGVLSVFLHLVNAAPIRRLLSSIAEWQGDERYPPLMEASAQMLASGLNDGRFTSVDLVRAYVRRIVEVNDQLHAITEINPDALEIATELDVERSTGFVRGPLHGIPILVKNNIATRDKMNTTAGSYALLGAQVPRDSSVVEKLRAAGAIILGKTNLSQWANYRSSNSSDGWSAIGGQVYGPFFPDQDPNGSSSGSAVASTLGLAFASLGTETDGSIISPSSVNNIVGLKPTVGLTSRNLVVPISEHQDTVGPLARTVMDAAVVLQAIAGVDVHDNYTFAIPNNGSIPDYVAACNPLSLVGARIGIPRNAIALRADHTFGPRLSAFEEAIAVLKDAGAVIVDNTNFTAAEAYLNSTVESQVLNADFLVDLEKYLTSLISNPYNLTSLDSIRKFTQSNPQEDYPDRNTAIWDDALDNQGWNNTDPRFWTAYQQDLYFGGEGGLLGAIVRHDLDAVILPSDRAPTWAAIVGAPMITVPLGSTPSNTTVETSPRHLVTSGPNIPFGLSFLGARFTESKLIGFSYAYEQRTQTRSQIHPYIAPTTELRDVLENY